MIRKAKNIHENALNAALVYFGRVLLLRLEKRSLAKVRVSPIIASLFRPCLRENVLKNAIGTRAGGEKPLKHVSERPPLYYPGTSSRDNPPFPPAIAPRIHARIMDNFLSPRECVSGAYELPRSNCPTADARHLHP